MRVVLDTTVLIDYLRGRAVVDRVKKLRRRGDVALTTAIDVEEVVRGRHPDEEAAAGVLFDGLGIVPLRRSEGRQALFSVPTSKPVAHAAASGRGSTCSRERSTGNSFASS